jgi:hypothetical protein
MGPEKSSYKRSWRVLERVDGRLQARSLKIENILYFWNMETKPNLQ